MDEPVIITCAVTGGMTVPSQSPHIPVTVEEIVEDALAAHAAGAAVLHVHVRDPATGEPSADLELFDQVLGGIAARCDAVLQPTTGGGMGMTIEQRAAVLDRFRPEMASFNGGSINFGLFGVLERGLALEAWERDYLEASRDYVFRNTFANLEYLCAEVRASETRPELEIYDVGQINNIRHLVDRGLLAAPLHLQFVLGVLGGNTAELDQLLHMLRTAERALGDDAFTWSVAGVGYRGEFQLAAAALMLGGHVRVGLEDNLRIAPSTLATSNAQLVDKAVQLAHLLDRRPVEAAEAREILRLKGSDATLIAP